MSPWGVVRERARLGDTAVAGPAVALASLCLIPLFTDLRWALPAAAMVCVVALLGAACRGLAMPAPFVPVVEGLGLVVTLTALFAADAAWARLLPTSQAWDVLRGLAQQGMVDADRYSAPVPPWPGVMLLAVAGVGLAALSVDVLFVSARMPVLAGMPILALYLAPAVVLSDAAPWWGPMPAAAGWLLVLAADQRERVRGWVGLSGAAT